GWRWVVVASAICSGAARLGVLLCLPGKRMPRTGGRLDLLGGVLFAPGLLGLLLALTNGSRWGWTSPGVLASAAGGAALLSLWVVHSLRQSEPLIDVRLFANRNIAVATLCAALGALGSFQISQFLL